jgi:hypothetical protein
MPNYELDNQLKELSGYVYKDSNSVKPKDWVELSSSEDKKTGFYAQAFYKGNDVVIAFRGTDANRGKKELAKDAFSDVKMGAGLLPAQIVDARDFYNQIQKEFPKQNIILTGHSLGGNLAQALGTETGKQTVTFGAYGLKNTLNPNSKSSDNITNYGNANDPIFVANIDNQIGKTYIMNDYEDNSGLVDKKLGINKDLDFDKHYPENMGDISKSVEYNGQNIQTEETQQLKASIEENVDSRDVDAKRVYTREDIGKMSSDEYQSKEKAITNQAKNVGVPTKAEADEAVSSGNMVWVEGYKRSDGTAVDGYYRSK